MPAFAASEQDFSLEGGIYGCRNLTRHMGRTGGYGFSGASVNPGSSSLARTSMIGRLSLRLITETGMPSRISVSSGWTPHRSREIQCSLASPPRGGTERLLQGGRDHEKMPLSACCLPQP